LASLAGTTLSTLRLVTYNDVKGHITPFVAVQRMGTASAAADNFARGGIAARVNDDGVLAPRAAMRHPVAGFTELESHPDTGRRIGGFRLPHWNDSLALARRAHVLYPGVPFIGWDVAVLEDGPVLLEGNPVWCPLLAQIPGWVPLGATSFPRMYMETLRAIDLRDQTPGPSAT
jgi:hypothetical protein